MFRIKTTLLIIFWITTAGVLALAVGMRMNSRDIINKIAKKKAAEKEITYDPGLLRKFKELQAEIDFNKDRCTYSGVINITDGSDTSASVRGLKFIYCRSDKKFYYQLGSTETIREDTLNLYIQHDQKKILLSRPETALNTPVRKVNLTPGLLNGESYTLSASGSGNLRQLSLKNEKHLTCKELTLSYDSLSDKVTKVFTRLTNIGDPFNKAKDRLVEINFQRVEDKANIDKYPAIKDIIKKVDGKWQLKSAFKDQYELITL